MGCKCQAVFYIVHTGHVKKSLPNDGKIILSRTPESGLPGTNRPGDEINPACGHETFLPQREGGCIADLPEQIEGMPKRKYIFKLDCEHMDWCDTILFLFDGRVPDEGACFELGYCYAKGKRCIDYKTDARSFIDGYDNVMLYGAPEIVLHNEEELLAFFAQ